MIYILTINYNSSALICQLIESLPEPQSPEYQIFIINNSPEDEAIFKLQSSRVKILEPNMNLGFGGGCNFGISHIASQDPQAVIWLLNPDTYFPKQPQKQYWKLINQIWQENSQLSILGTLIETPIGNIWFSQGFFNKHTGRIIDVQELMPSDNGLVETDWISGCSLMINLEKFKNCPYFDEAFFLYYEDSDFCLRYRALGHQLAVSSELKIIHQPSSITNKNQYAKLFHSSFSYLYFLQRHTSQLVFLICLSKFFLNTVFKLITQPQIGRAKYDGLISFIKKMTPDV
ncbi:glycosyl transferase family 2 [[Leptolyngbya] sp. PCC 7376]|uniref:glycosyltransferase family 2 protein n=1 Tax=[Leptolyngbya] sp. PCC 7376 TaxID=111781 RepID=UPI00029F059C|nr:glycosyltransferase family 2 protein [[Leptolyngbya] sp. PCC 7376]AFY36953.1 glycosyl transferase family 2 [[Leptolyngbya] sp. PCC 7376]